MLTGCEKGYKIEHIIVLHSHKVELVHLNHYRIVGQLYY